MTTEQKLAIAMETLESAYDYLSSCGYSDPSDPEYQMFSDIQDTLNKIQAVESCDFCNGDGEHLCPDVDESILIPCSKKGCSFVKPRKDLGIQFKAMFSKLEYKGGPPDQLFQFEVSFRNAIKINDPTNFNSSKVFHELNWLLNTKKVYKITIEEDLE